MTTSNAPLTREEIEEARKIVCDSQSKLARGDALITKLEQFIRLAKAAKRDELVDSLEYQANELRTDCANLRAAMTPVMAGIAAWEQGKL